MNEIEMMHRSSEAKQLKNNKLLNEAFDSVRDGLLRAMEDVGMADRDTQQAITLSIQVLRNIRVHIERCIDDEKVYEFNQSQPNVA